MRAPSLQAGMSHYLIQEIEATPNSACGPAQKSSMETAKVDSSSWCCEKAATDN